MLPLLGAILAIGMLIIVHEAGHYFVARWCRMRVDRFSLGFGPALFKWRRGETDFTLGPIPFGGFVQINGMTIADDIDPDDDRAYPNRPAWQRFLTIFAGPATNYVAAIVIAFGLYLTAGYPSGTSWYVVQEVKDGFDAAAKLEINDRIVGINGTPLYYRYKGKQQKKLQDYVQEVGGAPVTLTVLRDGQELDIEVVPKLSEVEEPAEEGEGDNTGSGTAGEANKKKPEKLYLIGITLAYHKERASVGPFQAAGQALIYPVRQTTTTVTDLVDVIRGEQEGTLTGPVGITSIIKSQIELGWIRALELLMLLNVLLGLFNLLPLPALDGGRLVFLGYEMVTRRRANPKVEATVHMVGIMALLVLMVLVTYNDIARLL